MGAADSSTPLSEGALLHAMMDIEERRRLVTKAKRQSKDMAISKGYACGGEDGFVFLDPPFAVICASFSE